MVRFVQFGFSLPKTMAAGLTVFDTPLLSGKSFRYVMIYSIREDRRSFV